MATSITIVLRKKKKADGTFPLALRITKDRKSSFIYLGYYINESDWDSDKQRVKKSHTNSVRLNNFLIAKLAEASGKSLEEETIKNEVSSKAIKLKVKPSSSSNFFEQADLYLNALKDAGKYNQYTADKPRIKHFREFLKGSDIILPEITEALIRNFGQYLKTRHKLASSKITLKKPKAGEAAIKEPKPLGERSIVNHYVAIRSVFSFAIKSGVVDAKYYPFGKGKLVIKFPESQKIGLTRDELKQLEEVELTETSHNHARNLWLFSYYFAGMRVSDVLRIRWSDFHDGRLHYIMGKNGKTGSLKVPEQVLAIVSQYEHEKKNNNDLIFPDLKALPSLDDKFLVQRRIAFTTSRIDKILRVHIGPKAGIEKRFPMHHTRHTFGDFAGSKIPIQMLQKLYRHSSVVTTIGYQSNFINEDADDALDAVIG